jgi:FtsP/CotA-like multicopper oxidase with cupredoxin domain
LLATDEWRDPSVCLKIEGAMPGNDVCADIRHASVNGQFGNGSSAFPWALVPVTAGKTYRMRFIAAFSNTENLVISLAGHNMTLVSVDGAYDVAPIAISSFNLHLGERIDVIVRADQPPGNYLINATYDYACALTPGHFIPPGFAAVPTCEFFAYLHYDGEDEFPQGQ